MLWYNNFMAEDKADKPRSAAELKAAQGLEKMIELSKQMPAAVNAMVEQVKKGEAARLAENLAERDRAFDRLARQPKLLDSVTDLAVLKQATHANSADVARRTCINKWVGGYGNVVYAYADTDPSQIQDLSTRITEQQNLFSALEADEQTKAKAKFASAKGTTGPYKDFLQSEVLGKRFKELKQSPPTPK